MILEKPTVDTGGGNGPDSMTAKDDVVKLLKNSYAYVLVRDQFMGYDRMHPNVIWPS
jgi:hypothetical protein